MKQFEEWFRYNAQKVFSTSDSFKETCEAFFQAGYEIAMKEVEGRRCAGCEHDGTFSILDDDKCMYCKRYNKSLRDNFKKKE